MNLKTVANKIRALLRRRNKSHPVADPDILIHWFLSGRRPKRKKHVDVSVGFNRLCRKFCTADEDIERGWIEGADGERIWKIRDLFAEADAALDVLQRQDEQLPKDSPGSVYSLCRKDWADMRFLGPYIPSDKTWGTLNFIDTRTGIPSFAFVGLNREKHGPIKNGSAKYAFVEIRRMANLPAGFRAPYGTIAAYEVGTMFLFDKKKGKGLDSLRHFAALKSDGQFYPVFRQQFTCRTPILHRCRTNKKNGPKVKKIYVPSNNWVEEKIDEDGYNPLHLASLALSFYRFIEMNWVVTCSDNRGRVNFSITPGEAKYLFRNRLTAKAADGKRKRIIHWVRAHTRITGSNVKTHLRGERFFEWNGMDVRVALPGKHTQRFIEMESRLGQYDFIIPAWAQSLGLDGWYTKRQMHKINRERKEREFTIKDTSTGEKIVFEHLGKVTENIEIAPQ